MRDYLRILSSLSDFSSILKLYAVAYYRKIRDAESYSDRLWKFLNDRLLRFNPYSVSDSKLLEGIGKMRWRGPYSLTQMVILNFLDVRPSDDGDSTHEKVVYSLGDSDQVITENMSVFTNRMTAADSLQQIRSTINNQRITQSHQIYSLVGKRVFVSRNVATVSLMGGMGKAMRMSRLKGKPEADATIIREAAVSAKLEMLGRLLAYPHAHTYLDGEPSTPVDIATPIRSLMAEIAAFPNVTGH